MIKNILAMAFLLSVGFSSMAQTTEGAAGELSSAPPVLAPGTAITPQTPASEVTTPKAPRKISYGLSAGTQFSRLFGTATFLEPSVMFPVTKRFSGFASVNMITTFGSGPYLFGNDNFNANYAPMRSQRFILNAGGNYLVTDRLNVTGSVWRDLSKNPQPLNLYMPGGTNGMSLRANYKVTENFSVSGGIRYSNGNAYNNMWYNPGSSWGY
ncbi:MAG: hypothetical protein ACO1OF_02465 [Adhaeribacter sp.]